MFDPKANRFHDPPDPEELPKLVPDRSPKNLMASAALFCAVMSFISVLVFVVAFIFGGLAITLACLGRGRRQKIVGKGCSALFMGLAGILASGVITFSSIGAQVYQYGGPKNYLYALYYTIETSMGHDVQDYDTGTIVTPEDLQALDLLPGSNQDGEDQ